MTRTKHHNTMPLSLVVRERAKLKQHPHEGVSFVLDETRSGLPAVIATLEDEHERSVDLTFDPSQLDAFIEELKELQLAVQWQMARSRWVFIRYSPKSKWHLRLAQWLDDHLCITKPRYAPTTIEIVEAGITLWDGSVCRQCVQLWTEQILSGWIRYQYAYTSSLLPDVRVETEGSEQ